MEEIDLITELRKGETYFENKTIRRYNFDIGSNEELHINSSELYFLNCTFQDFTSFTNINQSNLDVIFTSCFFKDRVRFNNCTIKSFLFYNIQEIKEIGIYGSNSKISLIMFHNSSLNKGIIEISGAKVEQIEFVDFHLKGQVHLISNVEKEKIKFGAKELYLSELTLNNYLIQKNHYSFKKINIEEKIYFENCHFDRVHFDESNLGKEVVFNDCKFNSYVGFEACKNINNTHFRLNACRFFSYSHFNNSEFDYLDITHTTFDKKVSFDSVKVNTVNLYQVSFLGGAFFDDFKITNPFNNDKTSITEKKRTYRTIKQELQKLENRIDYNIFRMYELTIHLQEVKESLKNKDYIENEKSNLLKDKCILWLHQYASNFGTDWRKALTFIFCSGFTFYTILYIIEHLNQEVDFSRIPHFATGFFNYILITNFDNPITGGSLSFIYFPSLIIFIFGKILIAFGIYEMIQSFRKFRY